MRREILAALSTAAVLSAPMMWGVDQSHDMAAVHAAGASHEAGTDVDQRIIMRNVEGTKIGVVTMRQQENFVRVRATPKMLTPGFHGFHVHDIGVCDAGAPDGPFTSAGGHYAGGGMAHGDHAGDMPSLLVKDTGKARLSVRTDRFTLAELREGDGTAVMIHAGEDNFANIPERYETGGVAGPDATTLATGDAGARIACGVIS